MSNVPAPFIQLRQRRDFSQVISTGFQFIRSNWKSLYRPLVFIALPLHLIASLFLGSYFRTTFSAVAEMNRASSNGDHDALLAMSERMTSAWWTMGLGYILIILASLITYAAVYEYMRYYQENKGLQPTTSEVWKAVLPQLGPYFAIALLCGIIMFFGFIFLIIPGIYIAITFTLVFPLRSFERADIVDVIGRSFKLISGKWWRTFVMIFLLLMLVGMITYVFYIPLIAIMGFSSFSDASRGQDPGAAMEELGLVMSIFMVVVSVVNVLLQPFVLVPLGVNAYSLIELKEGRGLAQQVDDLTFGPQA